MSKRFYPQQQGDRKRAKLDVSISDHNFPLSQNKELEPANNWGDDNDDEILLLASQACEDVYNNDLSMLPDYSMFMQPGSSSTQMYPPSGRSTSKNDFTFKKPSANPTSIISTNLKEKCTRISSPLPGITAQVMPKANVPENSIFDDKIYKGHDSDHVYRQLLQLQEENEKLKSENGKLLEKCVTKEGETSILRTQLKTCQVAVDNARLEKIKAQERVQMEWTEKLSLANNQMHDLRTQLDFKNLEIISIKEKCKKLESTKVKLTQVTVANNDISSSHRLSSSFAQNESITQNRRVKTSISAVQTDGNVPFLTLYNTLKTDTPNLTDLLPHILEASTSPHSILEYNEKLIHTGAPHKCKVYSTFHGVPSNSAVKQPGNGVQLAAIYEDIVKIVGGSDDEGVYSNFFTATRDCLTDVLSRLETIKQRMTTAFQKEMNEKYIESTSSFLDVSREDLLKGSTLYKEEQDISARRMITILSYILETPNSLCMLGHFEESSKSKEYLIIYIYQICDILDNTYCATVYSGLLLSMIYVIKSILNRNRHKTIEIIKRIIISRPMPFVSTQILYLVKDISLWENFRKLFCPGDATGNLKMDYDQGVLLYKKDSCHLQILVKQIEICLKCIENQDLKERAVDIARHLLILFTNCNLDFIGLVNDKSRCDCQLVLVQVIVYALRICAVMLQNTDDGSNASTHLELLSTCRCGIHTLYQCALKDVEFSSHLAHNEGHMVEFCEIMRLYGHSEFYVNMLSELTSTLQSTPEDMPPSFHIQPWLKSFEKFSMGD